MHTQKIAKAIAIGVLQTATRHRRSSTISTRTTNNSTANSRASQHLHTGPGVGFTGGYGGRGVGLLSDEDRRKW